ncbi:MAG: hypothetical protein HYV02_08850 [Deltaproteobacteria bacterium]|nr:hypothetical protein [Deltaproteobacteria bacterium]
MKGERPYDTMPETASASHESLLPNEIAGIIGGVARRVPDAAGRPADSMLAVYKERLTYTFILENEVASIHYDAGRREIFLRGHNIKFMPLSPPLLQSLWDLTEVLARDREGRALLAGYRETLGHLLADKT